jgi:aminoglycoside phosphotransferase (APT) family kinase protein
MTAVPLTWFPDGSVQALRAVLERNVPELASGEITLLPRIELADPQWWDGSAMVDNTFFVKFAWSEQAAQTVWREACIMQALSSHTPSLLTPRVIACSDDPVLMVTQWVVGDPLTYEHVGQMDRQSLERMANELAQFLAALHEPTVRDDLVKTVGPLATPLPQATTEAIRNRLTPWLRSDQIAWVGEWCDWTDSVLDTPKGVVVVHGDFHGHNHVWDLDKEKLKTVVDFADCGLADAEYDFRYLPSQGPGIDLLVQAVARYDTLADEEIDVSRVMAWNIRTVLGDALWRSEAGVPLPGDGIPSVWVDELHSKMHTLGVMT